MHQSLRPLARLANTVRAITVIAGMLIAVAAIGCDDREQADAPPANTTPVGGTAVDAGPSPANPIRWFENVTGERGPDFLHHIDRPDAYFMPDHVGSGLAVLDYDNDGLLDAYFIQNAPDTGNKNQLFHQEPDHTFTNVSEGSGADLQELGMGVAAGDVNNDGFVDLVVTSYINVRLLINQGGTGKFTDVTPTSGLSTPHWPTSAIFADFDRDGWLDLAIANYVLYVPSNKCTAMDGKIDYCGPSSFALTRTQIFRNVGQSGEPRFESRTEASGFAEAPSAGLGLFAFDFDGDGWKDLIVSNDANANHLWINQKDFSFKEEAISRGIAYTSGGMPRGNMGIAVGDIDRNGLFDIYITHLTEEGNNLWLADAPGLFRDSTSGASLASPAWRGTGFGTSIADLNNDGWPDVAATNGRIHRMRTGKPTEQTIERLGTHWAAYAERNHLFVNEKGRFKDISPLEDAFCLLPNVGRGLGTADLDNDGGIDLLVSTWGGHAAHYRNVVPDRGNWLTVKAVDPALGGRDAYGATVLVMTGDVRHLGLINPGYGYMTSNDPRAHLGLGDASVYDSIRIEWPDGSAEVFPGGSANRLVTIARGAGSPAPAP